MAVGPLLSGEPCDLVPDEVLDSLAVPAAAGTAGERDGTVFCRWQERSDGVSLLVSVEDGKSPLDLVRGREGVVETQVDGFAAMSLALQPDVLCELYVETAPAQGFWVIYSALDRRVDACGGASAVAVHLAGRLQK